MRVLGLVAALALSIPLAATAAQGEFQDCEACPVMVEVPPGSFARAHNLDEPAYGVAIGYAFAIGRFEVTVGEFREFAQETGIRVRRLPVVPDGRFRKLSAGRLGGPGVPATGIRGRSSVSAGTMRKPMPHGSATKPERRIGFPARPSGSMRRAPAPASLRSGSGAETSRPAGPSVRRASAATSWAARTNCRRRALEGVPLNPFGLSDLLGNAAEWTLDCANPSFASAPADGRPWPRRRLPAAHCARRHFP